MSLILRKWSQPLLDKEGLDDLHVEVRDRVLCLTGSCGKTVLMVSGIRFNNKTLTKVEIEYAIELFTTFINKHGKAIKVYVDKKKELYEIVQPKPEDFGGKPSYNSKMFVLGISVGKITVNVTVNNGNKVPTVTLGTLPLSIFEKVVAELPGVIVKANKYFKAAEGYDKLQAESGKLQAEINKCNI